MEPLAPYPKPLSSTIQYRRLFATLDSNRTHYKLASTLQYHQIHQYSTFQRRESKYSLRGSERFDCLMPRILRKNKVCTHASILASIDWIHRYRFQVSHRFLLGPSACLTLHHEEITFRIVFVWLSLISLGQTRERGVFEAKQENICKPVYRIATDGEMLDVYRARCTRRNAMRRCGNPPSSTQT